MLFTVVIGISYNLLTSTAAQTTFRTRLPGSALGGATGDLAAASLNLAAPTLPYFADKRNIFNQVFVKKAWFWTTLGVVAHTAVAYPRVNPSRPLLRLAIATGAWVLFTTWAFGPSINHRVLLLTGAKCVSPDFAASSSADASSLHPDLCLPASYNASSLEGQTSAVRPYWHGGHDVSGHTFILVHSILLLITTVSPTFSPTAKPTMVQTLVACAVLSLVGLWWWMLLMTSAWFHSPPEKLSGLLAGFLGWSSYWVVLGASSHFL